MSFFRIEHCGHYKRGEPDVPVFGGLSAMLAQLKQWGADQHQLALTKTFEASPDGDFLPLYLVDLSESQGTWLLTLWNQVPSSTGGVASIDGLSPLGSSNVTMSSLPNGGIPGFATYFWFLPAQQVIASIKFQHDIAGHAAMRVYINSFMKSFSSHAVHNTDSNGMVKVLGYRDTVTSPITHHRPKFYSSPFKVDGPQALIRNSAQRIRKILRRTVLSLDQKRERAYWQRALDNFGLTRPPTRPAGVKVSYEMEVAGLNADDVDRVIAEWSTDQENHSNDYGFVISGSPDVHWLGQSLVKEEFETVVTRVDEEIVSPLSLLSVLNDRKATILTKLGV